MNSLNKLLLPIAIGVFFAGLVQAANTPPQAGTILSESSVNCGSKVEKHKKSVDLLCQEYVVRTATNDYHVRQEKPGDQALIAVNTKIEFTVEKDKMKFKVDGKAHEYFIVSEAAAGPAQP